MKLAEGILTGLMLVGCLKGFAAEGAGGGNGGDAIVCPDRVYMLDVQEIEKKGKHVVFSDNSRTLKQKVDEAIDRIREKDLSLADEIAKRAEVFLNDVMAYADNGQLIQKDTEFTHDNLVNVSDEGAASIPNSCKIEQLIIQVVKPFYKEKKFRVQVDLWALMDETEKAVAVMHESIYGYLLQDKVNNSRSTRFFNGLVISDTLKEISDKDYIELLEEISFPSKEMSNFGVKFFSGDAQFDDEGNINFIKTGKFVKPVIKDVLVSAHSIKVGIFKGNRAWVAGIAQHPYGTHFVDIKTGRKLDLHYESYYNEFFNYITKKNVLTKESVKANGVQKKDFLALSVGEKIERTETGFNLSYVYVCNVRRIFLGDYRLRCDPYAALVVDQNGSFKPNN